MNYKMLLASLGLSVLGYNSYADEPTTEQQFTPFVCQGSYASSADMFSHNLFNAIKYGSSVSDHVREKERGYFIANLESHGYTALLDVLVALDRVPEQSRSSILCEAKEIAKNMKGRPTNAVFEIDLVAQLYEQARYYAAKEDGDPLINSTLYISLSDNYFSAGNIVAKETGIDTKPYAAKVVEAACKNAARYPDPYSPYAYEYLTFAEKVAGKERAVVCQPESK